MLEHLPVVLCSHDLSKNFSKATFSSKQKPRPGDVLAKMQSKPLLSDVASAIKLHVDKFTFDETPIEIWNGKYQFCSLSDSPIINKNEEAISEYVQHIFNLSHQNPNERIIILKGKTGSGKSTLNKYILTFFHDDFKKNHILPTRIEFRKLIQFINHIFASSGAQEKQPSVSFVKKAVFYYIETCLLRDLLNSAYSMQTQQLTGAPLISTNFENQPDPIQFMNFNLSENIKNFRAHCRQYGSPNEISDLQDNEFTNYIREISKRYELLDRKSRHGLIRDWRNSIELDATGGLVRRDADLTIMLYLVSFSIKEAKFTPFIIVDGMDYINIQDYLEYDNISKRVMDVIRESINTEDNVVKLPTSKTDMNPIWCFSMRENTIELFWEGRSNIGGRSQSLNHVVQAPALDLIVAKLFEAEYWINKTKIKDTIKSIVNTNCTALLDQVTSSNEKNIEKFKVNLDILFSGNVRHFQDYLRDILEDTFEAALARKDGDGDLNPDTLMGAARTYMSESRENHPYVALAIAMSSRSTHYKNFVTITQDEDGKLIPSDNDETSGYIGNIFNYHMPYTRGNSFVEFVHKIAIFDIVERRQAGVTLENISHELKYCSIQDVKFSLAIMCREGILRPVYENRNISYLVSPIGQIIRHFLLFNLTYLENVYFGCYIPLFLDEMVGRYAVRDPKKIDPWVKASFSNVLLLLSLIETAVKSGHIALNDLNTLNSAIKRRLGAVVDGSKVPIEKFQRICDSFSASDLICNCVAL